MAAASLTRLAEVGITNPAEVGKPNALRVQSHLRDEFIDAFAHSRYSIINDTIVKTACLAPTRRNRSNGSARFSEPRLLIIFILGNVLPGRPLGGQAGPRIVTDAPSRRRSKTSPPRRAEARLSVVGTVTDKKPLEARRP